MGMDSPMIVVYAASRNLYPVLPMAYMSLLKHNPDARVICLIEDDELPSYRFRDRESDILHQTY